MSKLIIANWKLNPLTLAEAQALAGKLERTSKHTAVVCPPTAFLAALDYPNLGAQDCFWMAKGAYTGQVSPAQLRSLGVRYCLVGHSERRELGQTDEEIQAVVRALLEYKITPVLCIGHGTTVNEDELAVVDVLRHQLDQGLGDVDPKKVVVAYEPVWAIGRGAPASPEHAEKIAIFVKTKYNVPRVLYGGSTNGTNAGPFLAQAHIDGLLVGGASLLAHDFNTIINL
jgi:triosephosphate isomerase (TIM)